MLSIDGGAVGSDGLDAAPRDAALQPDVPSLVGRADCLGDELVFSIASSPARSFGAAVDGIQLHLSYLEQGCDGIGLPGDPRGLRYARFSTTGGVDSNVALPSPHCASVRSPFLVAQAGSITAFFASASEQGDVLQSLLLDQGGASTDRAALFTLDGALAATLLGGAAAPLAAYVLDPRSSDAGSSIQTVQGDLKSEVLSVLAQHHPVALAVAALDGDASVGGAALWASDDATNRGVYLRLLDRAGAGLGTVSALSSALGARSAVAAATGKRGIGLVYTEAPGQADMHQLRFRQIGPQGSVSEPVALTQGDEDIGQTAIAAYSDGYAIAYRRLGGSLARQAEIRLLFVDSQGNIGGGRFVGLTTISGSAVDLRIAADGRIIVLWDALELVEADDAGTKKLVARLHVARLLCL